MTDMEPPSSGRFTTPWRHYDALAPVYDAERFSCRCGRTLNELELAIAGNLLLDCGRVVDVGTGTGRFAIAASRRSPLVVGLDASSRMIAEARIRRHDSASASRIVFVVGDGASLPFPTKTFDAVISVKLLSHHRQIDPFVGEMARILKENGRLILDAPNSLAPIYRKIVVRRSIQSHQDYFHPVSEIVESMQSHSVDFVRRVRYSLVPASLAHLVLCPHPRLASTGVLRQLFGARAGLLSFVEGIRPE